MSMSKKDYETIADVLTTCSDDRNDVILQMAYRFSEENPNFRWDLFLEACDYTGDYKIDRSGKIASPGKFENEAVYMPLAYEAMMDDAEEIDERLWKVQIAWAGEQNRVVLIHEDDQGFLWEQFGDVDDD